MQEPFKPYEGPWNDYGCCKYEGSEHWLDITLDKTPRIVIQDVTGG